MVWLNFLSEPSFPRLSELNIFKKMAINSFIKLALNTQEDNNTLFRVKYKCCLLSENYLEMQHLKLESVVLVSMFSLLV